MAAFPTLSLPEILASAARPTANTLVGLKLRPPASSFATPQPAAATPPGVDVGPTREAAALLDSPLPPVRPADLGGSTAQNVPLADTPLPPERPAGLGGPDDNPFAIAMRYGATNPTTITALNLARLFQQG